MTSFVPGRRSPPALRAWSVRSCAALLLLASQLPSNAHASARDAAAGAVPAPSELTIERLFAAPDLSGASLREPRFSPDASLVAYLQANAQDRDRLDLWAYDVTRREHRVLVDAARLVPRERALSPEEEARRERQRTASLRGILEYQFSPDSRAVLIPLAGDLYLYDLAAAPERAVRRLTSTESFETDARFSPRGRYVSFVRDGNLWILDLRDGRERALTSGGGSGALSYGVAEFIAQEEMDRTTGYWWSPDERRVAYTRVDESGVDELERFEILAQTIQVVRQRYPAAGRPNARVQLWLHELQGDAAPVRADLGSDEDVYLARVDWLPDSRALAVQRQSRDQRRLDLLRVEAASGASRILLSEQSEHWVELHDELTFLERQRAFIWASSRSGYRHLYLYDLDGRMLRALTSGEWMVAGDGRERAIVGVDERKGIVYFVANRDAPIERHLYAAPLAGPGTQSELRRISQGSGWHSVRMARDASRWLDLYSDPQTPPSLSLRRASDGALVATLVANRLDEPTHPYAPHAHAHQAPQFGTLQSADGQTLHYQLLRPANMQAGRRYPVIVETYGGPGVQRVRKAWSGTSGLYQQRLAQRGFVVFALDNRGSGFRGRRFETALHRRLGEVEVADQVRGVEFLRTLPYVDARRIGVWGWSYGGYLALLCATRAPEHFQAAVAGAPVTDWALYDTHYTERYMDTPQRNPEGYRAANVLTHAAGLAAPLLVLHGMADDNVLFTHSTALFKRLQDLGKPFDVMPYPGSKHGLLRFGATGPHAYRAIERFFETHLADAPRATLP